MALVPVYLGDAGGSTGGTTGSFTPTANSLMFASAGCRASASTLTVPAITDSATLTWTEIDATLLDQGSSTRNRSRLMYAIAPGSPAAMTVTVSASNTVRCGVMVFEIVGADQTFLSNFSHAPTDSANPGAAFTGDPTVVIGSLPNFYSTLLGFVWMAGNGGITPPTGYTELTEVGYGSDIKGELIYKTGVTSDTLVWNTPNSASGVILLEVRPPNLPRGQGMVL